MACLQVEIRPRDFSPLAPRPHRLFAVSLVGVPCFSALCLQNRCCQPSSQRRPHRAHCVLCSCHTLVNPDAGRARASVPTHPARSLCTRSAPAQPRAVAAPSSPAAEFRSRPPAGPTAVAVGTMSARSGPACCRSAASRVPCARAPLSDLRPPPPSRGQTSGRESGLLDVTPDVISVRLWRYRLLESPL